MCAIIPPTVDVPRVEGRRRKGRPTLKGGGFGGSGEREMGGGDGWEMGSVMKGKQKSTSGIKTAKQYANKIN